MSMPPVSGRAVFFDWMTEDLFLEVRYESGGHGEPAPSSGLTQRAFIAAPNADAARISGSSPVMTPFLQDFAISPQPGGARSAWWTPDPFPPPSIQAIYTPPPAPPQGIGLSATPPSVTAVLVNKLNNADVDALLWGYKWNTTALTYSFPTSADDYTGYASIVGFEEFNDIQKIFTERALANIASFSGLTFTLDEAGGDPAVLRFAEATQVNYTDDPLVAQHTGLHQLGNSGTAEGNPPELGYSGGAPYSAPHAQGDGWHTPGKYENPVAGTFAFAAGIMHELGHNLGLKHGHSAQSMHGVVFPALPADHDSQEYSIMTYRESPGSNLGSIYAVNLPTTFMMNDIAALQYLYGANYSHRSTNTTYSWDPTNGSFVIFDNTGAQGTTPNANVVFMTIWDGGGTDTYDFSNYTTNLKVSLVPGGYTNLGTQLANLGNDTPGNVTVFARGNIFNAMQDPNNPTEILSLIENAIGGTGNDEIVGNIVANVLSGGGGNDQITGGAGNDTMHGGTGNDVFLAITGVDTANGDGGDDAFYFTSVDGGVYDGGTGNDTVSFFGDANVYGDYDLSAPSFTTAFGGTFSNFENIIGSDNAETLIGNNADNVLSGAGGNDNINGGLGNDQLFGGEGDDVVFADGGDTMKGAGGDDVLVLSSIAAAGYFDGEFGSDTVVFSSLAAMTATYDLSIASFTTPLGGTFQGFENIRGTSGAETMYGNDVANRLEGGGGNDALYGRDGDDTLIGGAGTDQMFGQGGNDTYIEPIGDGVYEAADQGNDTVEISATYSIAALPNIENITLRGAGNFDATGNAARNRLTGNSGDNMIIGGAGDDILNGGDGHDLLIGHTDATATADEFDEIYGGEGNDTLIGGGGYDLLFGGAGNDLYINPGLSFIYEVLNEGTDTIRSDTSFDISSQANFENIELTGLANIDATGNTLANRLTGNADNNRLSGGAGNDTLVGGAGNDTLIGGAGNDTFINPTGDVITELAGGGTDTVESDVTFTLAGRQQVENLTLTGPGNIDGTGNSYANVIRGNAGNNTISGGSGNDTLIGGLGNDTYIDPTGDTIVEEIGGGIDTVRTASHFNLGALANVENVELTGIANYNAVGNALGNRMTGNDANNRLRGEGGVDTLVGGLGNDTYINPTGDVIIELPGGGADTVESDVTFSLTSLDQVENITLLGTANINAGGNAADNLLIGNAGNNILNGSTGIDTMIGGAGNDIYYVDRGGDQTVEELNGGIDLVSSSISRTLSANIENLNLTGIGNIDGNGNQLDNTINGNAGNNVMRGYAGNDVIRGNAGADTIVGGLGRDSINPGIDADRDIIRYAGVAESTGVTRDIVTGMDLNGEDRFDFPAIPTLIRAQVNAGTLSTASFDADLATAIGAGQLGAGQAVLFDPSAGNLNIAGRVYLIVDVNGIAGYQAGQDYVIELSNHTGTLTLDDFM